MPIRIPLGFFISFAICGSAIADPQYTLHENLHPGQQLKETITCHDKSKITSALNGNQTVTDTISGQDWNVILTIQAVKDGSATRTLVYFDPTSTDYTGTAGRESKSPCPFAGKSISLIRHPNESITSDFQGDASAYDRDAINNFICPDSDIYPDHPVSVGDTWDSSATIARHVPLGPRDQLLSFTRLDWVKTIDGKQMAELSNSTAVAYHEKGNVEEDVTYSSTNLVDTAAGTIVKSDETGSSQYKTPPSQAWQVTGGDEFVFHFEIPSDIAQSPKLKSAG
jgi:hypothetical protein